MQKKSLENRQKGILYMIIASFCFAMVGACTRILGNRINSVELVFYRNLIGVGFILLSLIRKPLSQTGGKTGLLIFRGVIGTIALYTFFYSITKIGLAEAITYQQSYPVFIAALSFFVAGEALKKNEWLAILLGFGGICVIFLPQMSSGHSETRNHLIGIANAILTAFAYMSIRSLSAHYDSRSVVLSFMLSGIVLPIISMVLAIYFKLPGLDFLVAAYVSPHGMEWLWIGVLGVAALIGQIYLTKAFSFGKAGVISAVGFSNILFSVFFGVLLGDSLPGIIAFAGICLVIVAGIIISYQTKKEH